MILSNDTFVLYAAKYYNNPSCVGMHEFKEDLKRFTNLKKLFRKYKQSQILSERLILNHIITLYNVFHPIQCTNMLVYKLNNYLSELKPFLLFLNMWQNPNDGIIMDQYIINKLRQIKNEGS